MPRLAVLFSLLFLIGGFTFAGASSAVTLAVTGVVDDLTAGDGQCTLREAILNANSDSDTTGGDCLPGTGPDEIMVPTGTYVLSIPGADEDAGATGDLDITGDLTVVGAGQAMTIIDAAGIDRVFHISSAAASVSIQRVTITGGSSDRGGGIYHQGQALAITDSTLTGNLSSFAGGGIASFASCTAPDCSTVALTRVTVANNESGVGGGISLAGEAGSAPEATLTGSTVFGNLASFGGGIGLGFVGLFGSPTMTVTNSTVTGNHAPGSGGCSLLGGGCSSGVGGGIYLGATDSTLELVNSTLVVNTASSPRGGVFDSSIGGSGEVTLRASILANAGCGFELIVNSEGHNVDDDGSCGLTHPTDLPNTEPLLGPLQDNGGPTETHALLLGSQAIDAVASGACSVNTDQRGVRRPRVGDGAGPALCDIGAYEVTQCTDGLDNDGDGRIDFDGGTTAGLAPEEITAPDPRCGASPTRLSERSVRRCGLGFELALLLLPFPWLHRRRRRSGA